MLEDEIVKVFETAGLNPIERGIAELQELMSPSASRGSVPYRTIVTNGTGQSRGAGGHAELELRST